MNFLYRYIPEKSSILLEHSAKEHLSVTPSPDSLYRTVVSATGGKQGKVKAKADNVFTEAGN